MCTVTYIPPTAHHGFIITINRDELEMRPTLPPKVHEHNGRALVYPKDEKAGGSWIVIRQPGRVCCLLNGAFGAHQKQIYHTRSRGTVLLELAASIKGMEEFFSSYSLSNVEPFTVVILDHDKGNITRFNEFIWDGKEKYFYDLDQDRSYIWSSATLYNEEQRRLRKEWFTKFLEASKDEITPESVFSFHLGSHIHDDAIDMVMQRVGGLRTVSITQVISKNGELIMGYKDMINKTNHEVAI